VKLVSFLYWVLVKITSFIIWVLTDRQGLEFMTFCILFFLLIIFIALVRLYEGESEDES